MDNTRDNRRADNLSAWYSAASGTGNGNGGVTSQPGLVADSQNTALIDKQWSQSSGSPCLGMV